MVAALFLFPLRVVASSVPWLMAPAFQLAYSEIPESEGRPTYHCCLAVSLSAETCHQFFMPRARGFLFAGAGGRIPAILYYLCRPVLPTSSALNSSSPSPPIARDGFNALAFVSPKQRRAGDDDLIIQNNPGGTAAPVADGIEAAAAGGGRCRGRRRELPCGPGGPRRRGERAAGAPGRRARRRVLQRVVPGGGGPGAHRDARPRRQGQDHRPRAAALHVPRLPRQGLRRVDHARVAEQEGGAGRHPELRPPRLRGGRAHQGQGGGGVPAHRVVRGHHRLGGPGRRVPEQRAALRRGDRAPGRQAVGQVRRRQRPPAALLQHCRPQDILQRQGPGLEGPRRPIRKPHDRECAVLVVRVGPPLQLQRARGAGPVAEQDVRGDAAGGVRGRPPERQHHGAHGPDQPLRIRPELLPRRAQRHEPVPLRQGAHGRPVDQGVRGADGLRGVARRVLRRLRGRHDQHGQARGAHGRQRGDQEDLHRVR